MDITVSPQQERSEKQLLWLGILLVIFLWPKGTGHDGLYRFTSLESLLDYGILDDFKFSLVGPLLATPLYFCGKWIMTPYWWICRFNALYFLFSLWALQHLLRAHVNAHVLRRFLLLLLAASLFSKQIKEYYGEPFTQLTAALSLAALVVGKEKTGFFGLVLSGLNTAGSVVSLGLALALRIWQSRRLRYLAVPPLVVAGVLLENWLRRGHPFFSGYEGESPPPGIYTVLPYTSGPAFTYPLFFGVLSIFLSFGKGLLFFTPGLFLLWGRRRQLVAPAMRQIFWLWFFYFLGLVLVYGRWFNWYGGGFWGPRFFLMASLPASFSLALYLSAAQKTLWSCLLSIAVLALSVWVSWNGLVVDESLVRGLSNDREALIWYAPEFSVLWRPLVVGMKFKINDLVFSGYYLLVFAVLSWPLWRQLPALAAACLGKHKKYSV